MADIRCQMCGKPNPADAEVCQFCQARLKPIWASKSSENFFESEPEPEEEVPEWLSSLRGPEESESEQASEEKQEEDSFGGIESRESAGGEDWLSGLGKPDEISPGAVGNVFDLQQGEDLSEWLASSAKPASEQPEPEGEPSENAAEPELPSSEEKPVESTFGEEGNLVDWLDRVQAGPKEEEEQPKGFLFEQEQAPEEVAPLGEEEVPDWLTRMTLGETDIPAESQPIPDWMKDATPAARDEFDAFFSSEPSTSQTPASEEIEPGTPESGIDWMTGVYGEAAAEFSGEAAAEAKGTPAGQEDFPEWLSALGVSPEEETPRVSQEREPISPEEPFAEPEQPVFGETPDWLSNLSGEGQESLEAAEEKPAPPVTAFEGFEDQSSVGQEPKVPDWLAKIDTEGVPPTTGGPSPFVPDEPEEAEPEGEYLSTTPDWLSQVGIEPAESEEALPHPEAEAEPGLERAALPNWLEAMRPVEAVSTEPYKDATDNRLESEGPLAGLRGALPAGAHAFRPRRSVVSALKIQVPEEQQNRATVLQKLLEDESVARPLPSPAFAATPILLRILIFGAFVLAAFFALWLGGKQVPIPSQNLIPQGVIDFHSQIGQLPEGLPVLFAVDYEPGFSGELDGAATAVLSQLASRNSLVVFVSTTYNGPALAQRLLQAVNQKPEFLRAPFTNTRNMGYIPGGAAGLSAFARTPDIVLPYDLNDNPLWESAVFDRSKGLSNFAMVIVLTHDADTARNWIEQVGPTLGGIPLQLVVSAQAEPLVQPYYAGIPKQISGLVSGMLGGVAYETLEGRSGLATQSWDAYSISLTLAVIMILVGGVFGVGSVTISQYKQSKAEGRV